MFGKQISYSTDEEIKRNTSPASVCLPISNKGTQDKQSPS